MKIEKRIIFVLVIALAMVFAGCASSPNQSERNSDPAVSGYISVGAGKTF